MKKIILSIIAAGMLSTSSAQLFSDHYDSGTIDTNQFKNSFLVGVTRIEQNLGPFLFTKNTGCSALEVASQGHGEWDLVEEYFNPAHTTISMTDNDKIYIRAKLTQASTDTIAKLVVVVGDNNNKTAMNAAVQTVNAMIINKKTWTLLEYSISDWTDQWGNNGAPNGTCDKTHINKIKVEVNNGFATYPAFGATKALQGTVVIDYMQIGGSAPSPTSTCYMSAADTTSIYKEHYNTGTVDTNQYKNSFLVSTVRIEQFNGPFAFTKNTSCSALEIQTGGHDEWDVCEQYFNSIHSTISMNFSDKIYVRAKLSPTSLDSIAKMVVTLSDDTKKTALNATVQPLCFMMLRKNNWSTLEYSITDWTDQWGNGGAPNGTCDKTKVQRINFAINNGFATYPAPGCTKALQGTIVIDYAQIGGVTPSIGSQCYVGIKENSLQDCIFNVSPNPANGLTKIHFVTNNDGNVIIKLHDVAGKEVAILLSENISKGEHEIIFDSKQFSEGFYLCTMTNNNQLLTTQKIIFSK
ncbi:MAG: T9SS type A sorting domain-containing protein [Bacteroidales bacterium]|nr:T9SS type A sorting domain-containing protein [Bacteroidales bacterium]